MWLGCGSVHLGTDWVARHTTVLQALAQVSASALAANALLFDRVLSNPSRLDADRAELALHLCWEPKLRPDAEDALVLVEPR